MNPPPLAAPPLWPALLFGALAGALGWGIRGQYGHETGAMIAGLLVSLTLTLVLCPGAPASSVLRAVAWGTVAFGFGGSMTYGQTIGLTQDVPHVGHWAAWRWGMLGLALKGGLWIGFAGLFLGLGLGGVRYRGRELGGAMLGALALCALGSWLLNEPYDPARQLLPKLYFSDDWRWEPGAVLTPRREVWGGLLFALAGLLGFTLWRRDPLAPRLALWGILGGALGFPLGQTLQSWPAWNPELVRRGLGAELAPLINWWNFMETTFGAVLGATLGAGLWFHRARIRPAVAVGGSPLPPALEASLLAGHIGLLSLAEFTDNRLAAAVYDFGLWLGLVPVALIAVGRWSPLWVLLPITALPIVGKTLRAAGAEPALLSPVRAGLFLGVMPLALTVWAAFRFQRQSAVAGVPAAVVLRPLLVLAVWLYFGLNYAFFRFPWPWSPWTSRTPNALVFSACAVGLTWLAWRRIPTRGESP